jgi:hypothetical protein
MKVYGQVQWPIDSSEPMVYVVSGGCPSAAWLASVSARSLPSEWLRALILPRCVRMPALQRVLSVCDGAERVTVDVVYVCGWAAQVALYEAEGARTVCEEVGEAELEAYVYAC